MIYITLLHGPLFLFKLLYIRFVEVDPNQLMRPAVPGHPGVHVATL